MPPTAERLRIQLAKMFRAVCQTMDLRLNGDQQKIDRYFDERNYDPKIPEGTRLTSRFDGIEENHTELEKKVDAWTGRSWWRRFLGVGPRKHANVLRIGSHNNEPGKREKKPRSGPYAIEGTRPTTPRPKI